VADISAKIIYDVVKHLVLDANINLPDDDYYALLNLYQNETNVLAKDVLKQILQNAKLAYDEKRPLCQDTGFVTVFLKIGQNVKILGDNLNCVVNNAISDAYNDYFLRKSIVEDALFKRINTKNNTPCLIHTEITDGDIIEIVLSVKGGGCENVSATKMLTPAHSVNGIKNFVIQTVKNAGSKPCPPIKIGVGIGSNFEGAAILSKKALFGKFTNEKEYEILEQEILDEVNKLNIGAMGLGGNSTCFAVHILSKPCHIASLPVAISISCHSSRSARAVISEDNITYDKYNKKFIDIENQNDNCDVINVAEIDRIRELKPGTNFLLSGKIFTARDAAHKKFDEAIAENRNLPFDIRNSIIFYAGPCPNNKNEIIGPIGPTTSARMDKFTPELYKRGLFATIGKGERSEEVKSAIDKYKGKYFTLTGGVASLLKKCVKSSKIIAYSELGAEAVYELEVEKLPLIVKI